MEIKIPLLDDLEKKLAEIESRLNAIEQYTNLFKPIEPRRKPIITIKDEITLPEVFRKDINSLSQEIRVRDKAKPGEKLRNFFPKKESIKRKKHLSDNQVREIRETDVRNVEDIKALINMYGSNDGTIRNIKSGDTRRGIVGHEDVVDGYYYRIEQPNRYQEKKNDLEDVSKRIIGELPHEDN